MTHTGNAWEAEMVVFALESSHEDGDPQYLRDCNQRLFDEQNFSDEHFDRLKKLITEPADSVRLHQHPNIPEGLKAELQAQYNCEELLQAEREEKEKVPEDGSDLQITLK